jgi:hypothetical protein
MKIAVAVAAVAVAVSLAPMPIASADESADSGTKVSQTDKTTAKPSLKTVGKAPAKVTSPKVNLPAPPKLPKPPKITLPNPYPPRDVKFPNMPEMPSNAPQWAKDLRLRINQFVKDHPGPGVRWVDENGNPI